MPNLRLIPGSLALIEAALQGDEALAQAAGVSVEPNWSEFGADILYYIKQKIIANPNDINWWFYFPVHIQNNRLIGTCGYKGPPNTAGEVEIGYEIAANYRNKGLATEAVAVLLAQAFMHPSVQKVIAHTLPENNASANVLTKSGFCKVAEVTDPDDGLVWRWELERP